MGLKKSPLNIKNNNNNSIVKWEEPNKHFSREDVDMTKRFMKKCATSIITQEMQIQITMMYYLIPVRMAVFRRQENKCWWRCGEKGNSCFALLLGMQIVQTLWKAVIWFQKIKNTNIIRSSNPTSGYVAKGHENGILKMYHTPILTNIITTIRRCSNLSVSADESRTKKWYAYMEYDSALKEENSASWDNMDRPRGHYAQWARQRERQNSIYHLYVKELN